MFYTSKIRNFNDFTRDNATHLAKKNMNEDVLLVCFKQIVSFFATIWHILQNWSVFALILKSYTPAQNILHESGLTF